MSNVKETQGKIKKQKNPTIGEIWSVAIPEYYEEDETLLVKINFRPVLILDDGRGLIVEENPDYHIFKITRQTSQKVKPIKKWREKGLNSKSYYRIEMPIKIEIQQFRKKIGEFSIEEMVEVYKDLLDYINIESIKKITNNEKDKVTE